MLVLKGVRDARATTLKQAEDLKSGGFTLELNKNKLYIYGEREKAEEESYYERW